MTQIILTQEESISTALGTVGIEAIKSELEKNVEFSQSLTITDLDNTQQFKVVKDAKNGYVKTRNTIKRAFKSKRDKNTQENRENLKAEGEVLATIEKEEDRLSALVEQAELRKLIQENEPKLEERKEALQKCEHSEPDKSLLEMSEKDFEIFLDGKRVEYTDRIEQERIADEIEQKRKDDLEKAKEEGRKEGIEQAKQQHLSSGTIKSKIVPTETMKTEEEAIELTEKSYIEELILVINSTTLEKLRLSTTRMSYKLPENLIEEFLLDLKK